MVTIPRRAFLASPVALALQPVTGQHVPVADPRESELLQAIDVALSIPVMPREAAALQLLINVVNTKLGKELLAVVNPAELWSVREESE